MITDATRRLIEREDLSAPEARGVMNEIMAGGATPSQIAGFLIALRMKGETVDEIAGCARAMREKCIAIPIEADGLVDTCGTGGDGAGTINISTAAAFVTAAAGVKVAKHGNRAVSSRCGSADVLETLGVRLSLSPSSVAESIREVGLGFLFAPSLHPAMKHALVPRRELGVRTVFNVLGPLCNPAGAERQVIGVYARHLTEPLARVLQSLGSRCVMVVHGLDGLDELTLTGPSQVAFLRDGRIESFTVAPEEVGLQRATAEALAGGTKEENARDLEEVMNGAPGPHRDVVVLNAGAAILVGGGAASLAEGVKVAAETIDSGAARRTLDALRDFTRRATEAQA